MNLINVLIQTTCWAIYLTAEYFVHPLYNKINISDSHGISLKNILYSLQLKFTISLHLPIKTNGDGDDFE